MTQKSRIFEKLTRKLKYVLNELNIKYRFERFFSSSGGPIYCNSCCMFAIWSRKPKYSDVLPLKPDCVYIKGVSFQFPKTVKTDMWGTHTFLFDGSSTSSELP